MSESVSSLLNENRSRNWWSRRVSSGLALLILGVVAGFFGFRVLAGSERPDPLREISGGFLYMDLEEEGPAATRATMFPDQRVPDRKRRVFQWAQSTYQGDLDREAVPLLIQAGRAASLEGRLSPSASAEMAVSMCAMEKELKEMILLVEEENLEAKKVLRNREGRHLLLKQQPYAQDSAYPKLQEMIALTRKGKGVVWGDAHPQGNLQLILLWEEWPGLKKLHDRRNAMLDRRRSRVRQWIEREFEGNGMTLFGS